MASRVLLLSVNEYGFPYPVFPLGVAQVEAALREAGHETRLVDFSMGRPDIGALVGEFGPDFVGISLRNIDDAMIGRRETFFGALTELTAELRRHTRAPVVLGGSGFSIFPELLLARSGADFGIQGEGESQFLALIGAVRGGGDVGAVSGLVYWREGRVVANPRTRVEAPDRIPRAFRRPEMVAHYLRVSSMLNVQTQRGCALQCVYCTYPLLEGRRYRRRPAEEVAEEMAEMAAMGARYAFVVDSVFNTSEGHVSEICEALIRRGTGLKWCCFLRPQRVGRGLMRLMARAGLAHVEFGSDSFSDPVLEAYGKGLTFGDIEEASGAARAEGVEHAHFLICGGPGETAETLEETVRRADAMRGAVLMARAGMRVYPGTPLYGQLARGGTGGMPAELLEPYYQLAEGMTAEGVLGRLRRAAAESPNWIVDDPPPVYHRLAERLRRKGVVGPLWSYAALLQRIGNVAAG